MPEPLEGNSLRIEKQAFVDITKDPKTLKCRKSPGIKGKDPDEDTLVSLDNGKVVTVKDGPIEKDSHAWWKVEPLRHEPCWAAESDSNERLLTPLVPTWTGPPPEMSNCPNELGKHPEIDIHEQWMFDEINDFREKNGLLRLKWDARLNTAADWFSGSSYTGSHEDSLGNHIDTRVKCFGFQFGATEVLSNTSDKSHEGVEYAFHWWSVVSHAHREQLLKPNVRLIGIGHSQNSPDASYEWVWVVTLGPFP